MRHAHSGMHERDTHPSLPLQIGSALVRNGKRQLFVASHSNLGGTVIFIRNEINARLVRMIVKKKILVDTQ
jgi:hypothetical protein